MQLPIAWMKFASLHESDLPLVEGHAYPPVELRYRALELVSPENAKVIILGQDPYHGAGEAHGLSFSVPKGIKAPPSLRNIFTELANDLGIPQPVDTDLARWARQGVLLLNTALSVAPDQPASHAKLGWNKVTDAIISALAQSEQPRAFILWGKHAQKKRPLIPDNGIHLVIESAHPSPFSVHKGFFGSRPFSRVNQWLKSHGMAEIDWQ